MIARFVINGNHVEVEGTPAELAEILFGIQPAAPEEPSVRKRTSFAKVYHQVLGMSIRDYVQKDLTVSTDSYVLDILNKIRAANLKEPPEDRLRETIEAARQPAGTGDQDG